MIHPFAEDTKDMTVSQLYDKVAELTNKYFATNNPQMQEQISTFIEYYKQELTYKRQFLIYLLELKSDVQISEQNIEGLQSKYQKEISELKNLIGNKSSIPKDQVYPKFDSLSQIYSQLLEEKNLAYLRKDLFQVLLEFK